MPGQVPHEVAPELVIYERVEKPRQVIVKRSRAMFRARPSCPAPECPPAKSLCKRNALPVVRNARSKQVIN